MFTVPFSYWGSGEAPLQNLLITGNGGTNAWNGVLCNQGVIKINSNGVIDNTFNAGGTGFITVGPRIVCAVKQSTGKIVCLINTYTYSPPYRYNSFGVDNVIGPLFRLNADGTFDSTFTLPTDINFLSAATSNSGGNNKGIVVLDDDSIVVINDVSGYSIKKYPANGSTTASASISLNNYATSIYKTYDNKIFVVGYFTTVGGISTNRMVRLNSDLTIDTSFAMSGGLNNSAFAVNVQSDGKPIIGGTYTIVNGASKSYINRQYVDGRVSGTYDSSYLATVASGIFATTYANMKLQSDGKLLYNGDASSIRRFNVDGTTDGTFTSLTPNGRIWSYVQLSDGKIMVSYSGTTLGGVATNYIFRLNADGTKDTTFSVIATAFGRNITIL